MSEKSSTGLASQQSSGVNAKAANKQLRFSEPHFAALCDFLKLTKEDLVNALKSHFVEGETQKAACELWGVSTTEMFRKVTLVREMHQRLIGIAEFYQLDDANLVEQRVVAQLIQRASEALKSYPAKLTEHGDPL